MLGDLTVHLLVSDVLYLFGYCPLNISNVEAHSCQVVPCEGLGHLLSSTLTFSQLIEETLGHLTLAAVMELFSVQLSPVHPFTHLHDRS